MVNGLNPDNALQHFTFTPSHTHSFTCGRNSHIWCHPLIRSGHPSRTCTQEAWSHSNFSISPKARPTAGVRVWATSSNVVFDIKTSPRWHEAWGTAWILIFTEASVDFQSCDITEPQLEHIIGLLLKSAVAQFDLPEAAEVCQVIRLTVKQIMTDDEQEGHLFTFSEREVQLGSRILYDWWCVLLCKPMHISVINQHSVQRQTDVTVFH